jgi:putative transposase
MPRNARCVWPGTAYHITQRGTNRGSVFFSAGDRQYYLALLAAYRAEANVRVLGYCLMSNHVHFVVVPECADGLGVLFRRVHGRYAQYLNVKKQRTGHLWQNRFYSCALSEQHLWTALKYVEENPVRAGMVAEAAAYRWSSAGAHLCGKDESGALDVDFWRESGGRERWEALLATPESEVRLRLLRRCTYAGRPFGEEDFLARMEERFQRSWRRWSFENASFPHARRVVMG